METNLIRICSWCKRMIDQDNKSYGVGVLARMVEFVEGDKVTHGLCRSCLERERIKMKTYKAQEAGR